MLWDVHIHIMLIIKTTTPQTMGGLQLHIHMCGMRMIHFCMHHHKPLSLFSLICKLKKDIGKKENDSKKENNSKKENCKNLL